MIFKNIGERSVAKNYRAVSLLSAVSKMFEKFFNYLLTDYLDKCGLFLISSVGLDLLVNCISTDSCIW